MVPEVLNHLSVYPVPGFLNNPSPVWNLKFSNHLSVYPVPGFLNSSRSVWNLKFSNHLSVYPVPGFLILPALYGN